MPKYQDEPDFKPDFGIKKFHSKKFDNSDEDAIIVTTPIKSEGIDRAFAPFLSGIPVEVFFRKR
jgi:hypothetical protein